MNHIEHSKSEFRLSPESVRLIERINSPQDLWDGLLSVQYEEAKEKMAKCMMEKIKKSIIDSTLQTIVRKREDFS